MMTNQKGKEMNPEPEATLKDCTATAEENQSLPFTKASPIWLAVESMEVFKKFPQNPHFAPLRELKEAQREGQAIAHMVTFSTLVEKAFDLHCSKRSLHECLEALNNLECHGFDIKPIELHIKNTLSINELVVRIFGEELVKHGEKRIKELSRANERIDEEIMELNQKLKVLESEKRENVLSVQRLTETMEGIKKKLSLGMELDPYHDLSALWFMVMNA